MVQGERYRAYLSTCDHARSLLKSRPTPCARWASQRPHSRIVIAVASMGFFLITLDISTVNVALAQIRAELGGGTIVQQWVTIN